MFQNILLAITLNFSFIISGNKTSLEYLSAIRPTQKAMKNSFYYLNKSRFLVKKKKPKLNITGEKSFYFQI